MNCYEILNISREKLKSSRYNVYTKSLLDYQSQNRIVKKAYEDRMQSLKTAITEDRTNKELVEMEKLIEKCKKAYLTINTAAKRFFYNRKLDEEKRKKISGEKIDKRLIQTAYDFFGISEENVNKMNEKMANVLIEEKKNNLKWEVNELLNNANNSKAEQEYLISFLIKVEREYESIKNQNTRRFYRELIDKENEIQKHKLEKNYIERRYKHKPDYSLIKTISSGRLAGKKLVVRKSTKNSLKIKLTEEMVIKKTAEIQYRNATGVYDSYVNEYNLKIGNEEHIIYTNLALNSLEINPKTGKPYNPKYHKVVTEELFSDMLIEGSKYNDGYIGMVEKDENKEYTTTLANKKMNPDEAEKRAAVAIVAERKEKLNKIKFEKKEKKRHKKGEER